jgi:hypothetical protein
MYYFMPIEWVKTASQINCFIYTVCVFLKHLKKEVVPKEVVPAINEVEGRRQCQNRRNVNNSDSEVVVPCSFLKNKHVLK